jgi:hypothetical protein
MRARIGPASLGYAVTGVQDDHPSLKLRVTNGELQIPPNPPFSKGGEYKEARSYFPAS